MKYIIIKAVHIITIIFNISYFFTGKSKCKLCGAVVTKLAQHIKRRHPDEADKGSDSLNVSKVNFSLSDIFVIQCHNWNLHNTHYCESLLMLNTRHRTIHLLVFFSGRDR